MIPHTQKIVGDPERGDGHDSDGRPGDCWRTCIAALLDVQNPLSVPHFLEEADWWESTQLFIRSKLGNAYSLRWWTSPAQIPGDHAYLIASGDSPRGNFQHAVIADGTGAVIHDPHPSRAGLAGQSSEYFAVIHDDLLTGGLR